MSILDGLGSSLFPTDPGLGVDPATAARMQNASMLQLGLGLLGSAHTVNPFMSAAGAVGGAQDEYQKATQTAFRNTLVKREQDRADTQAAQQADQIAQAQRQTAAQTGSRLLAGLAAAPDKNAYWNLVSKSPDVQQLAKLGIQLPPAATTNPDGTTTQPDLDTFAKQLGAVTSATLPSETKTQVVAPGSVLVGQDASGKVTPLFSAAPKAELQRTDSGLIFDPASGQYRDSTGHVLSSAEVSSREAQLAASKAAQTTAATNQAKLDALPKGSMDAMVESYMQTGNVPGGLARNPAMTSMFWGAVSDRALHDGNTLAATMAQSRQSGALKPAMEQTAKQLAANQSFLGTLDKNISAADQFAQRVGGDTSPAINNIFNKWKRGVTGDPDVSAFDVLNNSINGEAAKIASGGVGSVSTASDSQIKTQQSALNSAQNYKQWRAAANAMLLEGQNRIQSIAEQRDALTKQSAGAGAAAPPAAASAAQTPTVGWSVKKVAP